MFVIVWIRSCSSSNQITGCSLQQAQGRTGVVPSNTRGAGGLFFLFLSCFRVNSTRYEVLITGLRKRWQHPIMPSFSFSFFPSLFFKIPLPNAALQPSC